MRLHIDHFDGGRGLALGLTALTVAIPVLLGTLFHIKPEALVPFALALPFVTMGVLDAALSRGGPAFPTDTAVRTRSR